MNRWLFILNDAAYGSERPFNALRLALNLARTGSDDDVTVFGMGDASAPARRGQNTPNGYYNLERMLIGLIRRGGHVLLCGTCMDARGMRDEEVLGGAVRSTLDELADLTRSSDRVVVF